MKHLYVLLFFIGIGAGFASNKTNGGPIKNAWKLEQLYYDSISTGIDSVMMKFEFVLADDSVCYLNDGTYENFFYWLYHENTNQLSIYGDLDHQESPALTFNVVYVDEYNLVLVLDLSNYDYPFRIIEYRLVPDEDFFNIRFD